MTIGDEDPGFAGGSYVIAQKYLHDMAAWDAVTVEEQERVIGRAKLSNVEMDDELGAGEFGTDFIGYAATPSVTELMLQHMFLGDPPRELRPDSRLLDRSHWLSVLRPDSGLSRRSSAVAARGCR